MQVTCRASCDGNAVLGLETPLTKKEVANGINWKTYELSDIQEDSTPLCFSNCNGIQSTASLTLIVYCEWPGPGAALGKLGAGGGQGRPRFRCWLVGLRRISPKGRGTHLRRASLSFETPP